MATMNVSLPDEMAKRVDELASSGRFSSASEVVRAALRAMLEREEKLEWLRREVQVALNEIDRGEASELDFDQLIAEGEDRVRTAKKESA